MSGQVWAGIGRRSPRARGPVFAAVTAARSGPVPELVHTPSGERSNAVRKALVLCLTSAGRFVGLLLLLAFLALSSCALPILLLSLFWLG